MKTRTRALGSCLAMLVAAIGLGACGRGATVAAKSPDGYGDGDGANGPAAESSASRAASKARPFAGIDAPSSAAPAPEAMRREAPSAEERPGLGTEWGETRYSHVSHTS